MRLGHVAVLVVCIFGCSPGEDNWAKYRREHIYNGGPPSVSPDGERIVFSTPRSGNGDIYCFSRGQLTRLTNSDDFEAHPVYSPSGDKIAYVRERGGLRHAWIMNWDGSNQTQLTTGRAVDYLIGFSQDSSGIYFMCSFPTFGLGREARYYLIDVDGKTIRRQRHETVPSLPSEFTSTNGEFAVSFGPYASSPIRILDRETREAIRHVEIPRGLLSLPALAYGGKKLTFCLLENGADDVSVYFISRDNLVVQKLR
jgi:hypothetical protein